MGVLHLAISVFCSFSCAFLFLSATDSSMSIASIHGGAESIGLEGERNGKQFLQAHSWRTRLLAFSWWLKLRWLIDFRLVDCWWRSRSMVILLFSRLAYPNLRCPFFSLPHESPSPHTIPALDTAGLGFFGTGQKGRYCRFPGNLPGKLRGRGICGWEREGLSWLSLLPRYCMSERWEGWGERWEVACGRSGR